MKHQEVQEFSDCSLEALSLLHVLPLLDGANINELILRVLIERLGEIHDINLKGRPEERSIATYFVGFVCGSQERQN